jgi:hypothetical protein
MSLEKSCAGAADEVVRVVQLVMVQRRLAFLLIFISNFDLHSFDC